MLFSKNLLSAFLAVVAVGVSGTPVEVEKQALVILALCPDYWTGEKQIQECYPIAVYERECRNLTGLYNDWPKSAVIDPTTICDLHT